MDKKLNNLLGFDDFEKNWTEKKQKTTKRTEVGLDVLQEKLSKEEFDYEFGKYNKKIIFRNGRIKKY